MNNKQITGGSPALWRSFQERLLFPWGSDGQMIMMLHVYRPRHFQRTWFGVNQPSGCWVPVSARFQEPSSCPWTCPLCPHGQMTMTLHTYRPRKFQWTWFGVNGPSDCWVMASTNFGWLVAGRPNEWTNERMDRDHFIVPFFPSERAGDKKQTQKGEGLH